jgi:hypothetical protein
MPTNPTQYKEENVVPPQYEISDNIAFPKGVKRYTNDNGDIKNVELENKIAGGQITTSVVNKLHLIKLANDFPFLESDIPNPKHKDLFKVRTFSDLCKIDTRSMEYEADDFLYCKNLGFPINRLITLRRFPLPCTDNIWDKEAQGEPDIARMITYTSQDVNKLEELLSFSYNMKWKELTAEMEQATMQGEQSGLSGFMKKGAQFMDPELFKNTLRGENANNLDPKADQNKVYGPVNSITNTHIQDVGLEFSKEFELTFDYELRSINGRTPEYAMKDIIANILACTFNNAKFWPGARYWIGERPSKFYQQYQYLNSDEMETIIDGGLNSLKSFITSFGANTKGSAINTLKTAMTGGFAMALGKILDKVGRPGILTMNSLLSGEPTGFWHLTIGNPMNPTMTIGNLICTGVDFSFPTDSLSYGDFPTLLQVKVKLKPAQNKGREGIEMMFNMGKHRIYYAPKTVKVVKDNKNISSTTRKFFDYSEKEIDNALSESYDFIAGGVKSVTTTIKENVAKLDKSGNEDNPTSKNFDLIKSKTSNEIKISHRN